MLLNIFLVMTMSVCVGVLLGKTLRETRRTIHMRKLNKSLLAAEKRAREAEFDRW